MASELSEHMRQCGKRRHAPEVGVYEYSSPEQDPRLATEGVARCKQRMCTFCRVKWQRVRAREIRTAIDFWERGERRAVFFVTVTMRHNKNLSLGLMRRLLTKAWGSLWSGSVGQALAAKLGGKPEMIRADDDTYSFEAHWHPHVHGLVFCQTNEVTADELEDLLAVRWRQVLQGALGAFKSQVAAVLEKDTCRQWNRHSGAVRTKYDREARAPCSLIEDPAIREVRSGFVRLRPPAPSPTVELIADERAGMGEAREQLLELLRARGAGSGAVGFRGRARRAWAAVQWRSNYDAGGSKRAQPAFCCGDDGRGQVAIDPSQNVKRFRRRCDRVDTAGGPPLLSPQGSEALWEAERERERRRAAGAPDEALAPSTSPRAARWFAPDCRAESRKPTETNEEIADKIEEKQRDAWEWILGVPQCWACERGQECPNIRRRMEKTFGRRMVRPHRTLRESALEIERQLRRFTKKAIEPNRRYGVRVEDARNSEGLGNYLAKMGAMSLHLELANGASKLGSEGDDGLMHYTPPQLQAIAAEHGNPNRIQARRAYGELLRATFGLQPITFSSRKRLGLGPDPFEDNKKPEDADERDVMLEAARILRLAAGRVRGDLIGPLRSELDVDQTKLLAEAERIEAAAQTAGETKRFLGNIDGPEWDDLIEDGEARAEQGEGEGFLAELVRMHQEWRIESAPFLKPSEEADNRPVRLKAARSPPALAGPSYGWARHVVELEIRDRVDERLRKRADDREAARAAGGLNGGALPDESKSEARERLIEWFADMRRGAADTR